VTSFPTGFFDRADAASDAAFYDRARLVTHIDNAAVRGIGALYAELGLTGRVLDLMSSWVSHFCDQPRELAVLGMNADELARNPMATERLVHDLNVDPSLPYSAASFDAVTCAVSIDYLTRPVEVVREVARVLRPGAPVVVTFSNRCFPTKAVRGWLEADDARRVAIVGRYLRAAGGFDEPDVRWPVPGPGDPLYAVIARRSP
jgi:SAM-dependent methyltransferase